MVLAAVLTRRRAEKHYARAVDAYSAALECCPSAVLFANRAFAHISLENYGSALADAEASVGLDPSYTKARAAAGPPRDTRSRESPLPPQAYYRRAAARFLLGRHAEALRDFKQARSRSCAVRLRPLTRGRSGVEAAAHRQGRHREGEGV